MMELHFEIHMPILRTHPFLRLYADIDPAGMRKVCHSAVQPFHVNKHDVLFVEGESPHNDMHGARMLFVVEGELAYIQQDHMARLKQKHLGALREEAMVTAFR